MTERDDPYRLIPAPRAVPALEALVAPWQTQPEALRSDVPLLERFLDTCCTSEHGTELLARVLPHTLLSHVFPKPWRISLELMALWLPSMRTPEEHISAAFRHASQAPGTLDEIWDLLHRLELPWSVLRPLARLSARHDRGGVWEDLPSQDHRPPAAETLMLLGDLVPEFEGMALACRTFLEHFERLCGLQAVRIDRLNAEALAEGRELPTVDLVGPYGFHFPVPDSCAGDEIWRVTMLDALARHVREGRRVIEDEILAQIRDLLGGTDAKRLRRHAIAAIHRDIAVEIAGLINAHVPDHRLHRKSGVYRDVVKATTAQLVSAIYQVPMTADDVRTATNKRTKR